MILEKKFLKVYICNSVWTKVCFSFKCLENSRSLNEKFDDVLEFIRIFYIKKILIVDNFDLHYAKNFKKKIYDLIITLLCIYIWTVHLTLIRNHVAQNKSVIEMRIRKQLTIWIRWFFNGFLVLFLCIQMTHFSIDHIVSMGIFIYFSKIS